MYAQKENNKSDINTKRNNTEKNTEPKIYYLNS